MGGERRSSDPWVLAQTASYYDNSPAAHMLQLIVGRISIKCTPADHSFGRRKSIYTYIKGAHIEMGLAAAAAAALHLSRLPRLRPEIDFEPRVQFTIGLNSRIAYCDAGRNSKRNAAELNFGDEIEIAVFGFSVIELKKGRIFFHHISVSAHKRLCHLRIDNGNENSPA
jgi:hypothetical protein